MKIKNKLFITTIFAAALIGANAYAADFNYSGGGIVIEAENFVTNTAKWTVSADSSASGGKAVIARGNNTSLSNPVSEMGFDFEVTEKSYYNIWARIKAKDTGSDSVYISVDGSDYQSKFLAWNEDYYWVRLSRNELEEGEHSIDFISREPNFVLDQIIVTSRNTYLPNGIVSLVPLTGGEEIVSPYNAPEVTPPENTHPRVYFTDTDAIKKKLTADENAIAMKKLETMAKTPVSISTVYSDDILSIIESKAFYYAMNTDTAYEIGKEAAEAIAIIENMPATGADVTRRYGRKINILAEIYDWCYDILEDEEKKKIIELCTIYASEMEIGWPPSQQGAIVGHACEAQFLRDLMSFAIAVYDERPDVWNYIGGRFYEEFVPVRDFANKGFFNHQGTNYGYYRHLYDSYAYLLITGMGCEEPYSGEDLVKNSYTQIYLRRPDGNIFADGDMYTDRVAPFGYVNVGAEALLLDFAIGNDEYIKNEYYRQTLSANNGKVLQSFINDSPVLYLILNNPELETKLIYNLPKTMFCPSPIGMMIARTGWQDGIKSPVVTAMMKVGEYQFNNHQHLDSGSFQIYYKGLLAAESGEYTSYGNLHHNMYTSKSIAHNTMLVYDPSEETGAIERKNVNDGGQRVVNSYSEFYTLDQMLSSNAKTAETSAYEIDPENPDNPEYSYIKGNLTEAYTDKVSDFKRSFMFLNTGKTDVPGVMVVFDKINSSDKKFKKIWLMHSKAKPVTSGNQSVFTNTTDDGYNGKMTIDTLLPTVGNTEFYVEGSATSGWSVINRYKFDTNGWLREKIANYPATNTSFESEANTYRLEVSPKNPSEQDYFLNVIQVTDADSSAQLPVQLLESDLFYGAKVDGKNILFSKSGNKIAGKFTFRNSGAAEYIICDISQGKYKITDSNGSQYVNATENGGILRFSASGDITVTRTADAEVWGGDAENEEIDTAYIKYGDSYVYSPINPIRIEESDDFLVPVRLFGDIPGITALETADGMEFYNSQTDEKLATVTEGNNIVTGFGVIDCAVKPYIDEESGEMLALISDISAAVNLRAIYDKYSKTIFLEDSENGTWYVSYVPRSSKIVVNIFDKSSYDTDYIVAEYNGENLLSVSFIPRVGIDMYSGEILKSKEVTDVKLFRWNPDSLTPMGIATKAEMVNKHVGYAMPAVNNFTVNKMTKEVLENNKYRFIKANNADRECSANVQGFGYHYVGYDNGHRWIHYSSMFEIEKSNGAYSQVRARNRKGTGSKVIFSKKLEEGRYKFDILYDLTGMKSYVYINGELDTTSDISVLKANSNKEVYFSRVEHYLSGSNSEAAFTIQGAVVTQYDDTVSLTQLEKGIKNGMF